MFIQFDRLRKDEDGQTLVLAAVSMLVLALCVMATIHIGHVAYEKVQLQNAADQGAYSLAATVAEGFNFFAYTNRAMICHYAGLLTLYAWVSYLLYFDHTWVRLAKPSRWSPVIGEISAVITDVIDNCHALDEFVGYTAGPAINAFNYILFAFQSAMALFLATDVVITTPQAFTDSDSGAKMNKLAAVLGAASRVANTVELAKFVDYKDIKKLASMKADTDEGRMVMTDLINSARHPWVAGTDVKTNSWNTLAYLGRSFAIHIHLWLLIAGLDFQLRKEARTEEGATDSSQKRDQVYSVDAFKLRATASVGIADVTVGFTYLSQVWADKAKGGMSEALLDVDGHMWGGRLAKCHVLHVSCPGFISDGLLAPLNTPWKILVKLVEGLAIEEEQQGKHHLYPLGITPYAKFKPEAKWRAGFNEPDFMVFASKDLKEVNKLWTQSKIPSKYSLTIPGQKEAKIDFTDTQSGMPSWMSPGLNALSVARAYYHRPGDWREQPNFFNPFWGAKLEPVANHPLLESLHLGTLADKVITH